MTNPGRDVEQLLDHLPWVRNLALRLCDDVHRADDATQETWMAAALQPPRDGATVRSYLARILRNVLQMDRRGARRRQQRERTIAEHRVLTAAAASELVARAELDGALVAAVLRLPAAQREVVLLHHFEGLSIGDVANRVARSADSVRATLRRARGELRADLERSGALFSLALLRLPAAVAPTALASSLGLGVMVMKWKVLVAVATLVGVGAMVPWPGTVVVDSKNPLDADAGEHVLAVQSTRTPEELHEPATATASAPGVERVPAPVARRLQGHLQGADKRFAWTTTIQTTASWRDADGEQEHRSAAEVGSDGEFVVALPNPATASNLRVHCVAQDPWYVALDQTVDLTPGADDRFELQVAPASLLLGSIVDAGGMAIAGARVLLYPADAGVPREHAIAETRSADDGAWQLRLDADAETLMVVLPPADRSDLVPTGVATSVHGITELGATTLPTATTVTGTVRWSDGAPVPDAVVDWRFPAGVTLDKPLGLGWQNGQVRLRRVATTDASGRFSLPVGDGEQGTVMVQRAAGCLPATFTMVKAKAPQQVDLVVEGHPVTIRVLLEGMPAGRAGVEWRRDRMAGNYGTDEKGELRQLVLDVPLRLRAVVQDRGLASEWVEFRTGVPELVVLQLLPADGDALVVRLDGADLPHATFDWRATDGSVKRSMTLASDGGKFSMRVPAGGYRLRILGSEGQPSGYLLPDEHEVTLPANGELTVPVQLGGRVRLAVTDAAGTFLEGSYQLLHDGVPTTSSRATRTKVAVARKFPLAKHGPQTSDVQPPGTYEIVIDLGSSGEHRRTVQIDAGATVELRVVTP